MFKLKGSHIKNAGYCEETEPGEVNLKSCFRSKSAKVEMKKKNIKILSNAKKTETNRCRPDIQRLKFGGRCNEQQYCDIYFYSKQVYI